MLNGHSRILGREHAVPMRLASIAREKMTEALNRGVGAHDSRVAMLLPAERAGVEIRVPAVVIHHVVELEPGGLSPR